MPIEYRESGALYFGEQGAFVDRTGKTRFSSAKVGEGKMVPKLGDKGVEYADEESRLVQGLSNRFSDAGTAVGVVRGESAKPSAYTADGSGSHPYREPATPREIDAEEARLIARAKAEGFFWEGDLLKRIISKLGKRAGGTEHDVYILDDGKYPLVIRNTILDSYGFAHSSPAQYLKRLEDYNRVFPSLQVRVIGVSTNVRGNGVVWTAQPFVAGREFKSDAALRKAMEARGWARISGDTVYRHKETGVVISDAHTGNVLYRGGELYPIDVIIEEIPDSFQSSVDAAAVSNEEESSHANSGIRLSRATTQSQQSEPVATKDGRINTGRRGGLRLC